ncbi:hypothetical protein ABIC65_002885 [Sphingomonas trueperi]|uniref:hypothetical protein n=1 Tax=Sphingomonas trueperi TaxID=53317 RepID=UPI003393A91B
MISTLALAVTANWSIYANARFGYSICYPSSVLRPQREADNGDGRAFLGSDGTRLLAFGQWEGEAAGLAAWTKEQAQTYVGRLGKITYRAGRGDWMVFSGETGTGFVFYLKAMKHGDAFATFQLTYPATKTAQYRPIVQRLSQCLRWTRSPL